MIETLVFIVSAETQIALNNTNPTDGAELWPYDPRCTGIYFAPDTIQHVVNAQTRGDVTVEVNNKGVWIHALPGVPIYVGEPIYI